jgi:hypothetical protein
MEGNGNVRRFFSAVASEEDEAADTPAIRRRAPRNDSLMFIVFVSNISSDGIFSAHRWGSNNVLPAEGTNENAPRQEEHFEANIAREPTKS